MKKKSGWAENVILDNVTILWNIFNVDFNEVLCRMKDMWWGSMKCNVCTGNDYVTWVSVIK